MLWAFAMGVLLFQQAFLRAGAAASDRPNFLWITVEDMSPRLGCYGDTVASTPNIDRLAREGVRFTNTFATYGVCAPSRHTLITGMYPTTTGAMHMRTMTRTAALHLIKDPELLSIPVYEATPPAGVKCFTEYFRAAGYYCTNNAKTDYQFQNPITAWDESSQHGHWRNRPSPETPFFSVFNSEKTHESRLFEQSAPKVTDPAIVTVPPYYPDTPRIRAALARQYDNIAAMDVWVGDLLRQLEEDGLLEKTIIFFFSDHGDGLPRAKRWVYDSGTRVPLIIRFPNQQGAGTTNDELISFIDFAPTMLSLLGQETPGYFEGQVFLGAARVEPRRYVFNFCDRMDPAPETIRAVRDRRFRYVRNYRPELPYIGDIPYRDQLEMMQELLSLSREGKLGPKQWQFWAASKPLEELYDVGADPYEIQNLASDPLYVEKLAELRVAHEQWNRTHDDLGRIPETDLVRRLWPPEGEQPVTADPKISAVGSKVSMNCETEGASITYRLVGGSRWLLFSGPIPVTTPMQIEARAIRLGWKESRIVSVSIP